MLFLGWLKDNFSIVILLIHHTEIDAHNPISEAAPDVILQYFFLMILCLSTSE